jgi:membrane protein implicated in regulation of membrane protease activity
MKIALNIVAALLLITGVIWIPQGIHVLPGSFMTGQLQWALAGIALLFAVGLLLYVANRLLEQEEDQR